MDKIDTQNELVYKALLSGSHYTHMEGCNALNIGCYQRNVSYLRNDYGIPVRSVRIRTSRGGSCLRYFLDDEMRQQLLMNDCDTPLKAGKYLQTCARVAE